MSDGRIFLNRAFCKGNTGAMCFLPGKSAKARDKYGPGPVHIASLEGKAEVASLLLMRGGGATARNKEDLSALDIARKAGDADMCELPGNA